MELNQIERRALLIASGLLVLGVAVRIGAGPSEATWAWKPGESAHGSLDSTRARVEREIERAERIATPLAEGERLDPNRAPEDELQRLPGIGPSKAAAIVETRRSGPFLSADELLRVPGLGPLTVERLRPHLRFGTGSPSMRLPGDPGQPDASSPAAGSSPIGLRGRDESLDINRVGSAQLERLPGLGPVRAQAIVDHRDRNGPFRSIEEVTAVPGIGSALLKRLRRYLHVR